MIFNNLFKVLYNIGHIIWYKIHMVCLHLIDVELPIPSQFNTINLMKSPNQIEGDDIAKMLGHMDEDGSYIKEDNPYNGPYCETP
jgi:hypothetical protein